MHGAKLRRGPRGAWLKCSWGGNTCPHEGPSCSCLFWGKIHPICPHDSSKTGRWLFCLLVSMKPQVPPTPPPPFFLRHFSLMNLCLLSWLMQIVFSSSGAVSRGGSGTLALGNLSTPPRYYGLSEPFVLSFWLTIYRGWIQCVSDSCLPKTES